ncbi:MAG: ATP-binding cassette domain-containing protein [Anaerolineae bacterium]|nr:ATP-binding cassette domain-containing protein [Anaerolineae bacterium]
MSASRSISTADYGIVTAESLCVKGAGGAPINLTLRAGDRIGLLGAAGSGKQQLLRTLARLEKPAGGRIIWSGSDVTRRPRWLLGQRQSDVVLIWANPYALFADGTSPRRLLKTFTSRSRSAVDEPSHNVSFPAAMRDIQVGALSGYQRVRLALAYAEHKEALAVLLDDVFRSLNPGTWPALLEQLDRATEDHRALLMASQYPRALAHTDHILVLLNGEIVEQGPTTSVLQRPQHAYTQWLARRSTVQSYHTRDWQQTSQAYAQAELE